MDVRHQLKQIYEKIGNNQVDPNLAEEYPHLEIYEQLIKYEQQIDSLIKRKRVELQEMFIQPHRQIKSILRIVVGHSYSFNSAHSNFEWTVFVKGKLLDNSIS